MNMKFLEKKSVIKCLNCESKRLDFDGEENFEEFEYNDDGEIVKFFIPWECLDCGAKGNDVYETKLVEITMRIEIIRKESAL